MSIITPFLLRRFLNHSCEANLAVEEVAWDDGTTRLLFRALANIPSGAELTLDYAPEAALQPGDVAPPQPPTPGAQRCLCGTLSCRGWISEGF